MTRSPTRSGVRVQRVLPRRQRHVPRAVRPHLHHFLHHTLGNYLLGIARPRRGPRVPHRLFRPLEGVGEEFDLGTGLDVANSVEEVVRADQRRTPQALFELAVVTDGEVPLLDPQAPLRNSLLAEHLAQPLDRRLRELGVHSHIRQPALGPRQALLNVADDERLQPVPRYDDQRESLTNRDLRADEDAGEVERILRGHGDHRIQARLVERPADLLGVDHGLSRAHAHRPLPHHARA
jgi:hypothetical protein